MMTIRTYIFFLFKLIFCCLLLAPTLSHAQPINDVCSTAIAITESGNYAVNTQDATVDLAASTCDEFRSTTKGAWYYMVGKGNEVIISTCLTGTAIDTWIGVYKGLCDNLSCVVYDDNDENNDPMGNCGVNNASILRFTAEENVTYYILVGGIMGTDVGNIAFGFFCSGDNDCIAEDECPDSRKIIPSVCGCNKTDYSVDGNAPTIIKNAPLTISNPVNDTTCLHGDAQFAINATAGTEEATLAYRWQVTMNQIAFSENGATTFTDISDDEYYTNSTTHTLNITQAPQNFDELQYRVIVTQTLGNTNCIDTSAVAILSVFAPPTVSINPQTDTICVTNDTQFSMEAMAGEATANLTYLWQISTNGGSTFDNLSDDMLYQGTQTKKLSITNIPLSLDEYQYRTIVTQTIGSIQCADTTEVATLYVFEPPTISLNPTADTACITNNAQFDMEAVVGETAGQLSYHWQVSMGAGLPFMNITDNVLYQGTQTKKLSITNTPHSLDEYQYRAIATQTIGTNQCFDTTEVATLYVFLPPTISLNPTADTACITNNAQFDMEAAVGETAGQLSYHWQVSMGAGLNFTDLIDNTRYQGTQTKKLSITNTPHSLDEYQYRTIITQTIGRVQCFDTTEVASLYVFQPPTISLNPKADTTCITNNAQFDMAAAVGETAGQLSYHWQVSMGAGLPFTDIIDNVLYQGTQTKKLSITNTPHSLDEYQYRAIATETIGTNHCFDTTEVTTLYVFQPPTISLNPKADTACITNNAQFDMEAAVGETEGQLSYHWQVSTGAGLPFMNITDDALYQGTQTKKLSITNTPHSLDEYQYRAIATQTIGTNRCFDTTTVTTLYIFQPPTVSLNPENSTICVQQGTTFSGDATSSEAGMLSYEWEVSSDGGQQFMAISDGEIYSQENTKELKLDNVLFSFNQHLYRLIVKEKVGTIICQDTSTFAKITVKDNPRINRVGQKFHDICGDMIDLSGMTTPDSEGSWTFVNAAPENSAELSDTNNIETLVTGVFGGQYTLRWTISNSVCKGRMDEIQIDFNPDKDLPGGLPDGAQDCVDLCIGGDDRINSDNLGMPDDCDCLPSDTTNEFAQVLNEEFQLFVEQQIALGLDTLLRKGDFELTSNAVLDPSKEENDFPTVIFQAYQSITLTEGFHVKSGAHFMAKLGYCRNPLTGQTNTVTGFNNRPKIILPTSRPILEKVPIPAKTIQFEVFPTVVKQQAGIALSLPATNQVSIGLYDQNGRFIKTYLENSQFEAGKYYFQLDASALSAGLYILRLVGTKEVISKKIIVQ